MTTRAAVAYSPRDVAVERRRALVALVRAHIIELRYIERRHGLRAARFDDRYTLTPVEEACGDGGPVAVVVKLEA